MPGGRTKARITVAINPILARALDGQAASKGMTRSAAVEEALSKWLRSRIEETYAVLERGAENNGRARSGLSEASEARIASGMVLEALRHQFPAMRDVTDEELRRRALASQEGRR
jgi:hypothetical protein